MSDRIKQMLNQVSQDYNASKYLSSSDKPAERQRSDKFDGQGQPKGIDFAKAAQFSYPAPRDPQAWQRPSFDTNWNAREFTSPVDPVDEAMKVLHDVQCDGAVCELNHTVFSDMDRPRVSDIPLSKKRRQKFSMPDEEFDPEGAPKKRRGFFGLFRRKK